jgi:hypothetical protein
MRDESLMPKESKLQRYVLSMVSLCAWAVRETLQHSQQQQQQQQQQQTVNE